MDREPHSGVAERKRALREQARTARLSLAPEQRAQAATLLAEHLGSMPELAIARVVLAYGATPEEIDPAPAVDRLRSCGATIAYPRIAENGTLTLHAVDDAGELEAGPFGLRQPSARAPIVDAAELDAVIVPGVAFDGDGRRLGYGGGYYDRLLPTLRADCALIGVAFDEQLFEELPAEPHDARLHAVVTPTRVLRRRRR